MASAAKRRELRSERLRNSGREYFECLECGAALTHAGTHLVRVHGINEREYKIKHAIPLGEKLITKRLAETISRASSRPERLRQLRRMIESPKHLAHLRSNAKRFAKMIGEIRRARMSEEQRHGCVARMCANLPRAHETRRANNLALGLHVKRTCARCGKEYETKRSIKLKFCSRDCYHEDRRQS